MWQPPAHYPYPPYPSGAAVGAAGAPFPYPPYGGFPYPYMYTHPSLGAKPPEPLKKKRGRPSKRKKRNKLAKAEVRPRPRGWADRERRLCSALLPLRPADGLWVGGLVACVCALAGCAQAAGYSICNVLQPASARGEGGQPGADNGGDRQEAGGNVAGHGAGCAQRVGGEGHLGQGSLHGGLCLRAARLVWPRGGLRCGGNCSCASVFFCVVCQRHGTMSCREHVLFVYHVGDNRVP